MCGVSVMTSRLPTFEAKGQTGTRGRAIAIATPL